MTAEGFWKELQELKEEYSIGVSKRPDKRSAKRITILVSTLFLKYGDERAIHWVTSLETAIYKLCKKNKLSCDELPMESNKTRVNSTEFEEWAICMNDNNYPHIIESATKVIEQLKKENDEDEEFSRDGKRTRVTSNNGNQETRFSRDAKQRVPLC